MPRNQQLAVVGSLLVIGVVAALPFARQAEPTSTEPGSQKTGFAARDIPLQLQVQAGVSPAAGLMDEESAEAARTGVTTATIQRNRLENQGLPPDLPETYHSLVASPLPEGGARRLSQPPTAPPTREPLFAPDIRERELPPLEEKKAAPRERRHRIVDGDTLARLAERYWGDAKLADSLFEANRAVLPSPDPLPLGVTITIPSAPAQPALVPVNLHPTLELTAPVRQPPAGSVDDLPLAPIPAGALGPSREP